MSADLEGLVAGLDDDDREVLLALLRPREWRVSWRYLSPERTGSWSGDERTWQTEYEAVRHGRALQAMADATDEIRGVTIESRPRQLYSGDWSEHFGWLEAPAVVSSEPL